MVTNLPPIESRTSLPPEVSSAGEARHFVRNTLSAWDLLDCEEVTSLAVSELVTNAVLHARSRAELVMAFAGESLRVEVHDESPVMPSRKRYAIDAGTGRGMLLVEALVGSWGADLTATGKVVWFELRIGDAPPPAAFELDADTLADLDELGFGGEGSDPVASEPCTQGQGPEALVTLGAWV